MSEEAQEIRFRSDSLFVGETGSVDHQNCIITGVSVITGGVEAEGHALQVDETTLQQLQACAKAKGKVSVNLDHGTGVKDLNGYLTYFRMDGNKLRADWHLLKSHDETPKMLERADVMPTCFGLSVAFKGPPKGVPTGGGKMAARCEKLLSVDCVTRPAANDGLFSAKEVDNKKIGMAEETQAAQPSNAELLEAIRDLHGRLEQQEQFSQQLVEQLQQGGEEEGEDPGPQLEQLMGLSDEELASLGTNRAEVMAAVDEYNAALGGEGGGEESGAEGTGAEAGGHVDAGVESVAAGSGGAELSALRREVIALKKKQQLVELRARDEAETIEFAAIEEKVMVIAEQRDRAIQLAENYQAENEALRLAVRTGTRPVKAGVDNGLRLFSANGDGQLHEFQLRVKQMMGDGKTEAQAIQLAQKENPALHQDWVLSGRRQVA